MKGEGDEGRGGVWKGQGAKLRKGLAWRVGREGEAKGPAGPGRRLGALGVRLPRIRHLERQEALGGIWRWRMEGTEEGVAGGRVLEESSPVQSGSCETERDQDQD